MADQPYPVTTSEPVALINARLVDLAEANALYGKDQRLGAPDKIARNDREISWLKDLRSIIVTGAHAQGSVIRSDSVAQMERASAPDEGRRDTCSNPVAAINAQTACCLGFAPSSECRCEQERLAQGHPPYQRAPAQAAPGCGTPGCTDPNCKYGQDECIFERVFKDACDEIGCAYDNEALLQAIHDLKTSALLLTDAQKIIAEYQASTTAAAKADVAAHGLPGARVQETPDLTSQVVRLRYAIIGYLEVFDRCGGSESVSPETFAAARQDLRDAVVFSSTQSGGAA